MRNGSKYIALAAAWALSCPSIAFAADKGAEGKSLGLPQFDVTTYPSQLFWMFVTFTLCYLIFSGKILPELSAIIHNRQERIENDLQTAKALREEIDQVREDYEQALGQARTTASANLNEVQEQARARAEKQSREFVAQSMEQVAEFESRTQTLKQKALSDIRENVASAACDIADKTAGLSVTQEDALDTVNDKLGISKAA